jgi:2-hydroxy-3-keto-5-methylthiopentenyl-1-phosphate phosphatase
VPVLAHHAEISGDRWRVKLIEIPRLAEHCSHCKCVTVLAQKKAGRVVYIGDGYTDLCPVQHADAVFATGRLAQECADRKRPFIPFQTFSDIEHELAKLIEPEQDLRR